MFDAYYICLLRHGMEMKLEGSGVRKEMRQTMIASVYEKEYTMTQEMHVSAQWEAFAWHWMARSRTWP